MNKIETIEALANVTEMSKPDAKKYLEAVLEVFSTELVKGGEINLTGFGKFSVSERAERMGRNPQDGSEMLIKASKNAKFKAGKGLKDALNA